MNDGENPKLRKGAKAMAEVNVVKQPKQERTAAEMERWFATPLFRDTFFGMNPFAFLRNFTEMEKAFGPLPKTTANGGWIPAIEVKEKDGKLCVTAELPGLKKEEVKVHIDENTLVLEGERKQEKEEKREGYYHTERSYGRFYRAIPLPEGAEVDKVAAEFINGVLEVSIPVPKIEHKRREIPVKEGVKVKAA